MATKNLNLGIVPVSRGEFNSTTIYYKDNIVQYKRGSYQVVSESPITGISPTNDKNVVNPGWTLFAGTLDAQDVVNQVKDQETKSIQAVAAKEAEILAKSDAAEVSFNNTDTSLRGTNMQDALKETDDKINQLKNAGYLYAGIATPTTNPGTPEGPVFYIATTAGSYSNFSNIEVLKGETTILKWNSGTWVKSDFKLMTDFNSVFDFNGNSLTYKLDTLGSNISELETKTKDVRFTNETDDSLYVCDSIGRVVAKLDNGGISVNNIKRFSNYQLITIGDSLCASNVWNTKCAELLGCKFDADANVKAGQAISQGGTRTWYGALDSAFFRCKNLVDQGIIKNEGENTIILFESVNDYNAGSPSSFGGSIEDKAVVPSTPIETNKTEDEFTSSYLQSISSKAKLDACCALIRLGNGKVLKVTNLPIREGNVALKVGSSGTGLIDYSIHLDAPFTMERVIGKIIEYSFTGVTDTEGSNPDEVVFAAEGTGYNTLVQFVDTDNTGMAVSISDTSSAKVRYSKFFKGSSVNEWSDLSKWENGTTYMNPWRAWKSCLEYIIAKYPKAHIFVCGFPLYSVNPETYKNDNGTFNHYEFNNTNYQVWQKEFFELENQLCKLYHIPFLDVANNCGINLSNFLNYYNANDVHPKKEGYYKFAECIAKMIENNIK